MSEEPQDTPASVAFDQVELEALVQGIDHREIVELVKNTRYLRQNVFAGYRPQKLPWHLVPSKLANDVRGNPQGLEILFSMWTRSNADLLADVEALDPDDLETGVAELLVEHGVENRLQLLWALRLDPREEIQSALESSLDHDLVDETSALLGRVEVTGLTAALRNAQHKATDLQAELDATRQRLSNLQEVLRHKTDQLQQIQAARAALDTDRQVLLERVGDLEMALRATEQASSEIQQERDEQAVLIQELRQSVTDLKASLRAQAESFRESDVQRNLDQALLELEEERKTSSSLRLQLSKLERQLSSALDKRDEEQQRADGIQESLERSERVREVIISEKRKLTNNLQKAEQELTALRLQAQAAPEGEFLLGLPAEDVGKHWNQAQSTIRDQIQALVAHLKGGAESATSPDRRQTWDQWMAQEQTLIEEALAPSAFDLDRAAETLPDLEKAQHLLALRWYLLEYTRQAIELALESDLDRG